MQNVLEDAMPIIVNNYAKIFGVKVRMQGSMAYTNGSIITIPRLNLRNVRLCRIAYGYLAHEAAHIRYTDFKLVKKMHKSDLSFILFNILEDARIERIIGREFVGVYENLELILQQSESKWEEFERKVNLGEIGLLQTLICSLYYYSTVKSQGFFSQRAKAYFLIKNLRKILNHRLLNQFLFYISTINFCRNSQDVVLLVKKIQKFLEDKFSSLLKKDKDLLKEENLNSKKTRNLTKAQRKIEYKEAFFELTESVLGNRDDILPVQKAENILTSEAVKSSDLSIKDDLGMMSEGLCKSGRKDFINEIDSTKGIRHALTQKIKAWTLYQGRETISGKRFDVVRLSRLPAGESRIFKDYVKEEEFQTSVHLLVDVSGSMLFFDESSTRSRCEEACEAALMIALSLEGIDGIKTLVTYFPGLDYEYDIALKASERASFVAPRFDQKARGSTPLAQALWYAISCVKSLGCNRNIIFVLTDGVPDSVKQTSSALNFCKSLNIETYGIGIDSDYIVKLIPKSIVIKKVSDLRLAMVKLFSNMFSIPTSQQ